MMDILGNKEDVSNKESVNIHTKFKPRKNIQDIHEEQDKEDADKLIKEIEFTNDSSPQHKETKEIILIKSELVKNFNKYVDDIKIDIEGNVLDVKEVKILAKDVFKSILPQMIASIQKGGKHTEFYEFMLSTFEKQFYVLIDKKLSGFTGRTIKQLASKELFEKNNNIINLKVGGMMNDMMMSITEPLGYKLSYEMKNYDLARSVHSVYNYWSEYWTLEKRGEFFNRLNNKVYDKLFK